MGVAICDVTAGMHGPGVTEIAFYGLFSDGNFLADIWRSVYACG
jgi:hypothetical protein